MRTIIGFYTAATILLVALGAALLFQLTVLAGLIPTGMVWGGRLGSEAERTVMASVAIALLVLMICIVLIRLGRIWRSHQRVARIGMWVIAFLFGLNTVGNLFAADPRETMIFTPITFILTLLAIRVALGEPAEPTGP